MAGIEKILLVCNPSMVRSQALRRGIQLARRSKAQLHLCIFAFDEAIELTASRVSTEVMERARTQFLDERMKWLEQEAVACAESGLRVECDAVWAPRFAEAVVAKAFDVKADLVIKDVQQQSSLRRMLLLPRDWKLMRFCPAPLWLAFPDTESLPRHILAAVDPAEKSKEAEALNDAVINAALGMARHCAAEVHVATSFPYSSTLDYVYPLLSEELRKARLDHTQAFERLTSRLHIPAERSHALSGEPAHALTDFALQTHIDLLVVGSHFRSGWDRLALGSTSESLLNQIHCDVLLIKPEGVLEEIQQHLYLPT